MYLFQAKNVTKVYAAHKALDDVSLDVPEGQVFGLLGPNGAGKTTLIRIINQITAPDSGEILFKGKPLQSSDVERIGYLPEERGLYKKMRVGEQAVYLAQLKGLTKADATKKLKYWFDKFEIMPWWNKKVEELSKGMQQKIQFVVTILHEPELLIFDEPFSGFDPINANLLKEEILKLKDKGTTIIFSTHNMSSVEEVCDHIALINKSKKILDGPVENIRKQYQDNAYECFYEGDAAACQKILDQYTLDVHEQQGTGHYFKVRLQSSETSNTLLQQLLPYAQIRRFNQMLPNMNEIFIKAVEQANKQ